MTTSLATYTYWAMGAAVALQVALFYLAWWRPQRAVLLLLGSVQSLLCLQLAGVSDFPVWVFNLSTALWLTVGGAQLFYVLFALPKGAELWRIAAIAQPCMLPFVLLAAGLAGRAEAPLLIEDSMLRLHILSATLAYGLFTVAAVCAFVVYTRESYLKAHATSSFVQKLPSLQIAEKGQQAALLCGVLMLLPAVVAGVWEQASWLAPVWKSLVAYVLLIAATLLVVLRQWFGLRGSTAGLLVLVLYALLIVAFLGTRVLDSLQSLS